MDYTNIYQKNYNNALRSKFMFKILFIFFCAAFFPAFCTLDPFVVITPEKSGTHLLTRALTFLTGKQVFHVWDRTATVSELDHYLETAESEGKYFHMHAFPEPNIVEAFKQRGYKVIFLLRDPRDQLISVLYYIHDFRWEYENLRMDYPFGQLSKDEQIEEMITGEKFSIRVPHDFFIRRISWMDMEGLSVCTVRFENLVGEKGGGSLMDQIDELMTLADFLTIELSIDNAQQIAEQLFGWQGLATFRSGQIGSWKTHFNEQHITSFKRHFGNLLIDLGYESNFEW